VLLRFGLEGCEALLPGLLALVEAGSEQGLKKVRTQQQQQQQQLQLQLLGTASHQTQIA
jgi:hypothetical protein